MIKLSRNIGVCQSMITSLQSPVCRSCHTCLWIISHITMCNVTHMNEPCYTSVSNVTRIDESRDTNEWFVSRIWMRHIIPSFGVCVRPVYEHTFTAPSLSVMPHMSMNHVTHNLESCHTYESAISHVSMSRVTHMRESSHTEHWSECSHVTHT